MTTLCAAGVEIGRDYLDVGLASSGWCWSRSAATASISTVSAARSDKGFRTEYTVLRDAGKPAKVDIVRKTDVAANAIVKTNRPWNKSN